MLQDQALVPLYKAMQEVTSRSLFSLARLNAIIGVNSGRYTPGINKERYTYPSAIYVEPGQLQATIRRGENWKTPGNIVMPPGGVVVVLGETRHTPALELGLDHNNAYRVRFLKGEANCGEVEVEPSHAVRSGMDLFRVEVPSNASSTGYDRIHVVPLPGDPKSSLGHLRFLE